MHARVDCRYVDFYVISIKSVGTFVLIESHKYVTVTLIRY